MTEQEIKLLLAAAMHYDNRNPGHSAVLAWQEAANRARWTFNTALNALHEHYAESTDFLMPGHITTRIRRDRRHPENITGIALQHATERTELPARPGDTAPPINLHHEVRKLADKLTRPTAPHTRNTNTDTRQQARTELANLTPAPIPTSDEETR